jgi:hypothetical protein
MVGEGSVYLFNKQGNQRAAAAVVSAMSRTDPVLRVDGQKARGLWADT